MPKELTLTKRRAIDGAAIDLPGSKSITNRALLLAALSDNFVDLTGVLDSEDTRHMLSALGDLGVKISENRDGSLRIQGCRGRFPAGAVQWRNIPRRFSDCGSPPASSDRTAAYPHRGTPSPRPAYSPRTR